VAAFWLQRVINILEQVFCGENSSGIAPSGQWATRSYVPERTRRLPNITAMMPKNMQIATIPRAEAGPMDKTSQDIPTTGNRPQRTAMRSISWLCI